MKKLIAVIMSVIMMAMPVLSLAASPAEMLEAAWNNGRALKITGSFEIGETLFALAEMDEASAAIVGDLLDALAFSVTTQENGMVKGALELSGQEAVNVTLEPTEKELYIASSLMGNKVVAMTEEEMWTTMGHFINYFAASGMIDEDAAAEVVAMLPMLPALVEEAIMADPMVTMLTSLLGAVEQSGAVDVLNRLLAKATVTVPDGQTRDFDMAAERMDMKLAANDIVDLIEVFVKIASAVPELAAMMELGDMEDVQAELQDMREALAAANAAFEICVMVDDTGAIVYGYIAAVGSPDNPEMVHAYVEYKRQTNAQGVGHSVLMTDGTNEISMNMLTDSATRDYFDFVAKEREAEEAVFHIVYDNNKNYGETEATSNGTLEISINDGYEPVVMNASFNVNAVQNGQDATCETVVNLGAMGMELVSVKLKTETCDAMQTIKVNKMARPGKMTFEEFVADFDGKFANSAAMNLMNVLQLLPESILALLMQ